MASRKRPEPADDAQVLSRLWEIAHKYQRSLQRGDVVPLGEAEGDRRAVAPFGERLHTTTERNLDGITYRSLAEMQVRRDTRRLLSNLPGSLRLRRLGFEVAVRARPVVFMHGSGPLRALGLLASVNYQTEQVETLPEAAALLHELDESEHRVAMRDVDEAELERQRGEVKQRLVGRRFARGELAGSLSSSEADLLSQLSRRGEVAVVVRGDGSVEIRHGGARRRAGRTVAVAIKPRRTSRRDG